MFLEDIEIDEKFEELNSVCIDFARKLGIPTPKIILIETERQKNDFLNGEKTKGKCLPNKNAILINTFDFPNKYISMATCFHEIAHLYTLFIMKNNLYKDKVEKLTYQQYTKLIVNFFKTDTFPSTKLFENFKKFMCEIKLTKNFINLLYIDKLYYKKVFDIQPYFYNVDSHELIAEHLSQCEMLHLKETKKITDDNDFQKYLSSEDYFKNGDTKLKSIYVEQNATSNEIPILSAFKFIKSIKQKQDMKDINSYDIELYTSLYEKAKETYENLRK